jgi:hypothetical protein
MELDAIKKLILRDLLIAKKKSTVVLFSNDPDAG